MGSSFTVAAFLQVVRGYNAIETGVIFTAATLGLLATSLAAERLAKRWPQRTLITTGFVVTIAGIVVLIAMVNGFPSAWAFAPGLLLLGLGLGVMLTPRSTSSSRLPRGAAGRDLRPVPHACPTSAPRWARPSPAPILVAGLTDRAYAAAMIALAAVGLLGLAAAAVLPRTTRASPA